MKISGAIFDMDGTLIDSLGYWDVLWKTLGEKYLNDKDFSPSPYTQKAVRTVTMREAARIIHENEKIGKSTDEIFVLADALLLDFYRNTVELKPGAMELLEFLCSNKVKMCVASASAPHLLDAVIEKFGFDKFFPKIISCNDVGKGKEEPDVFIVAHEYLDTGKDETWIFEDSVVALQTAHDAGYNTVGVYDKYGFDIERIKRISTIFIDCGESFTSLFDKIEIN
jgi:HAD superfamily hydrolase (TIGR01509 family)